MAYGIIHGIFRPDLHGVKNNQLKYSSMGGVTRDATSGIYVPSTSAEWTTTLAAAGILTGNPFALHLLQDASGNPTDSIGAFPLTASGTGIGYKGAVTGWTRTGVTTTDGGTGLLASTSAGLADTLTNSYMALTYVVTMVLPASQRNILNVAVTNAEGVIVVNTTGKLRSVSGGNTTDGAGSIINIVEPIVHRVNITTLAATTTGLADKISPTYSAPVSSKRISLGSVGSGSAAATYLYAAWFSGAAAEMTDAQVRTLLRTLGWTITW